MKTKLGVVFAVAGGFLIAPGSLWAHHSDAVYDMTRMTIIKGTITEHQLINPHQIIKMKVKAANGKVTPWMLVGANVRSVRADGWTQDTLKPGDEVTVWGFAYRDGKPNMTWNRMVTADGKMLPMSNIKSDKLARYLGTYGRKDLTSEDYEAFKKSLTPRGTIADVNKVRGL